MKNFIINICVLTMLIYSSHIFATVTCSTRYAVSVSNPVYATIPGFGWSGPANSLAVGTSLSAWKASGNIYAVFSCPSGTGLTGSSTVYSYIAPAIQPISNMTYTLSGTQYSVFPTAVPGIGYIVGAADPAYSYSPLSSSALYMMTGNDYQALGLKYFVQFVVTGPLKSGSYTIPAQTIAYIQLRDGSSISYTFNLNLSSTTVNVTATTCIVNTANLNVTLPAINTINLSSVGSTSLSVPFNLSLNCPSSLNIYMTFTDNSNLGNVSNVLSLGGNSSGSGVGVQIKKADGSLVNFGPDSANKGAVNQFLLMSGLIGNKIFPFSAHVVRTGNIVPGTLSAISTFTFSYQ